MIIRVRRFQGLCFEVLKEDRKQGMFLLWEPHSAQLDEISCDKKTNTADCWEKSYLTINQIVAFSSCDQN